MPLTEQRPLAHGRAAYFAHESRLLAGNRYGDPHLRHHPVWLPPSWDQDKRRSYPVLFGLAGYTATGDHLFAPGTFREGMGERLSRLMGEGMPECIFVAPDCMTRLGGSQYTDGAAGPYASFLMEELFPALETELRGNGRRGVLGHSSGGFGALHLAFEFPGRVAAISCQSGDMAFEYSVLPAVVDCIEVLEAYEGDESSRLEAFIDDFWSEVKPSSKRGHALMMLACAAAYDPDDTQKAGFRLPFERPGGRLRPTNWDRWLALDPVRRVAQDADALRQLELLHIECGRFDQYSLQLGARLLHEQLQELQVSHDYDEFPDNHSGLAYRYDLTLKKVLSTLTEEARA